MPFNKEVKMEQFYEYQVRCIDELKPNPNNPNVHDEKNISELASSLKEWKFTNPILIDEKDEIIAGHGRWQAAKHIGYEHVPTITLSGLSEEQKIGYMIADNSLPHGSVWDEGLLIQNLEALEDMDFDVDLLALENVESLDLSMDLEELEDGHALDAGRELKESGTRLVIGEYSFPIDRDVYLKWQEEIREAGGFSRDEVLETIKARLKLC